MNVFVKLVAVRRQQVAKGKFNRPVPPCQKAFVGVAKIRFRIFDNASQ